MRDNLPNLEVLVGGASIDGNADPALLNPYGIIPVNPDKGNINDQLSADFVNWLTSLETQEVIGEFGTDTFGQPLFYPDSEAWRSR
jgi:tungstate transport system substrate-binding protein